MSTAFHHQTDGHMECINQIIEADSRNHINYKQNDWSEMLAMADFTYTDSKPLGNEGVTIPCDLWI